MSEAYIERQWGILNAGRFRLLCFMTYRRENTVQIITAINFKNSMMCNEIYCGAKYHTLVHKSLQ